MNMTDPFTELMAPSPWAVLRAASEVAEESTADLRGLSRRRPLVQWRQVTMSAIRELTGMSYPALGRMFDRDHKTVMHACHRVDGSEQALRAREAIVAWVSARDAEGACLGQEVLAL